MKRYLIIFVLLLCLQLRGQNYAGMWFSEDLSNSKIQMYQSGDESWYGKIIKSENPTYKDVMIFKGKYDPSKKVIIGVFTTPKSKMNIDTKVYLDNNNTIRFVGKKFFISKTYIWKRTEN